MTEVCVPRLVYRMPEAVQRVLVGCFLGCVLERHAGGYRACPGPVMPRTWLPPVHSIRSDVAERAIASGLLVPIQVGLLGDAQAWMEANAAARACAVTVRGGA